MGHVYEPVITWNIILTYKLMGKEYKEAFRTISELRLYFGRFPRQAELVGYVQKRERRLSDRELNISEAKLSFEYADQHTIGGNNFDNVFKFVEFLKAHPPLAKCVGYMEKQRRK